jgi:hypothetical protein
MHPGIKMISYTSLGVPEYFIILMTTGEERIVENCK